MSDLIDRQAAIDALDCINGAEEVLRALPSVQPDHVADTGKKVERASETAQNVSDSDLISRKAVTDALAKFVPYAICDESTESYANGLTDAYNLILQLPSAQPEQRWISCSERMPVEGQKCLVCDKGSIVIDTYIGHGNPYNWKWYTRDYEAWMPLPEPYRGGDSNE
jgi:hypothetical protein